MPAERPERTGSLQRRSAARTAVVWDALVEVLERAGGSSAPVSVLDVGGGTGGFAVRVAELGHRVMVVDPSPDALAILARRAEERGVADLVTGRQGDLDSLPGLLAQGESPGTDDPSDDPSDDPAAGAVDVVLCHGVLEIVEDPAAALAVLARALRPGGTLSLLVNQRHAAVMARAMAGHFTAARSMLENPADPPAGPPRRFAVEEVTAVLDQVGLELRSVHGVRVFVDLVPSSLVDLEPGAAQALVDLEHAVSTRPEYLTLATQLHVVSTRR